jgi:hypothetical protein
MSEITEAHRRRHRALREQVEDAIANLNALYAETARPYRARLTIAEPAPDADAIDDDELDDDSDALDDPYAGRDDELYRRSLREDGEV